MHEPVARTIQYKQLKLASRSEHAKSGTRKKDAYSRAERAAGYTQRDVQAMTRGSTCRIQGSKLWQPLPRSVAPQLGQGKDRHTNAKVCK